MVGEVSEVAGPRAVKRDDGTWLIDGMLPVDEFKSLFGIDYLPEEDSGSYQTLGGFIITHLHRIPAAGTRFTAGGYTYEVLDMDGLRVDKVLLTPPVADEATAVGE